VLKKAVVERLKALDIKATVVSKNIGYELRCADPIPYDMEYTRDLGYCAAKYLLDAAMPSWCRSRAATSCRCVQAAPRSEDGTGKIRLVDIHSTRYAIAAGT